MQDAKARVIEAIEIRETVNADVDEVLDCEWQSFGPRAWPERRYRSAMHSQNLICMVAAFKSWDHRIGHPCTVVAGHMVFQQHNSRIILLRLAVGWSFQRHGIGTMMLKRLKSRLSYRGRHTIEIEVPETYLDAQLFLRANDFVAVGIDRDVNIPGRDIILFRHSPFGIATHERNSGEQRPGKHSPDN